MHTGILRQKGLDFDLETTINRRRSARSFQMKPLEKSLGEKLAAFAAGIKVPFAHATEILFFKADPTKTLYFAFASPPDNAAFLSATDPVVISQTGFIGELLVLYAESLGLATCWYGHYKLAELERLLPHLENPTQLKEANMGFGYSKGITTGRRAICITPLGYYQPKGLRLADRITKRTVSFKRKALPLLLENSEAATDIPADILYALDLARKAPSAANSQMWRFAFRDDYKIITVTMPAGYRHFKWEHPDVDIGICACHLWLGLLLKGYDPEVSVHEAASRAVWTISLK